MKRRSLLVGSALASVGAILGVGKVGEEVAPTVMVTAPALPMPMSGYEIKQQLDRGGISRKTAIEAMGLDAEEIEEASNLWSRDAILARERFITNPSPEWLEMNTRAARPEPYRITLDPRG